MAMSVSLSFRDEKVAMTVDDEGWTLVASQSLAWPISCE